mmetsp:Transcript_119047/g.237378  ORF Transcript_119047/g.237378 Transcript_119047/m.237378 type:complete len:201 (+) Transcript_119047:233-835(+)
MDVWRTVTAGCAGECCSCPSGLQQRRCAGNRPSKFSRQFALTGGSVTSWSCCGHCEGCGCPHSTRRGGFCPWCCQPLSGSNWCFDRSRSAAAGGDCERAGWNTRSSHIRCASRCANPGSFACRRWLGPWLLVKHNTIDKWRGPDPDGGRCQKPAQHGPQRQSAGVNHVVSCLWHCFGCGELTTCWGHHCAARGEWYSWMR